MNSSSVAGRRSSFYGQLLQPTGELRGGGLFAVAVAVGKHLEDLALFCPGFGKICKLILLAFPSVSETLGLPQPESESGG